MGNPRFLKEKYTDLNKSPEVESAARRTEARTDIKLPMSKAEDRIQNHLNRLREIFENSDKDKREHGIEFVKQKLHEQFVIQPEEIPEAYFESIKRKHREEGYGNIEIPDDYRRELSETVVADQVRSLDNWVDYLSSDDAKYPDWLKYFAVRSILRMGRYDKKKKSFTERTGGTTAPFPDLNREALAIVLESFERQAKGEQPKFGYDIQEETKKQFLDFLGKKNFAKLYALAIEEFKPIADELLQITEGEWRTYPRGSNPKELVESIAPYGTGWCLRGESMAERYLRENELQVFYSLDKEGNPTVPRVVTVVNANNQLTEVRGVAPQENTDRYIDDVVEEKLKEFPDGELYKKKSRDMKLMTSIENKVKQEQELTKEDLIFLYEINAPIEGFGYPGDLTPRLDELRQGRNTEEDMLVIFECTREQIAHVPSQINETTRAYVGQLEPDIFLKLPENIEHVYTSFPENRIRKEDFVNGGRSEDQLITEIKERDNISKYGESMLKNEEFIKSLYNNTNLPREQWTLKQPEKMTLVRLTVADLGFKSNATTDQIYERAQILGLELCPADTGPNYRLKYRNQPLNEWIYMSMKQITGSVGDPDVFGLERNDYGLCLNVFWATPDDGWRPVDEFVFRLRKSES